MFKLKIIQGNNKMEFGPLELKDCCEVIEKLKVSNLETRFYVTKLSEKEK